MTTMLNKLLTEAEKKSDIKRRNMHIFHVQSMLEKVRDGMSSYIYTLAHPEDYFNDSGQTKPDDVLSPELSKKLDELVKLFPAIKEAEKVLADHLKKEKF